MSHVRNHASKLPLFAKPSHIIRRLSYTIPFDAWDSAICDFDKAYRAHCVKVTKNIKKGKIDDPRNKCKFKLHSKNDLQQSFEVHNGNFNGNNKDNAFTFLFKTGQFNTSEEFPFVYNEAKKRWTPLATIRVFRE